MNIQTARERLAAALKAMIAAGDIPAWWKVTLVTEPDVHSGLAQVGHATRVVQESMRSWNVDIPITLWVNEADATRSAADLYLLISPEPTSLPRRLRELDTLSIGVVDVGAVAPHDEGQNTFLNVDVTVTVSIDSEPIP